MSRHLLQLLLVCYAAFALTAGCNSKNESAEPVTNVDELSEFLDENPELNVNLDEDEKEENL